MQTTTITAARKPKHSLLLSVFGSFLVLLLPTLSTLGATFTVTNAQDNGAGSLRAAIQKANTNGEADMINFDPTFFKVARTITLTSGEIPITADDLSLNGQVGRLVTINGPGAGLLTISGNNASRIFLLTGESGQNANVIMSGMTLRDGNGVSAVYESGNGGAIYARVAASLTLNSMVLRNNSPAGTGGAIYSNATQKVVINDSVITENSAGSTGGLYLNNVQELAFTMANTTVSNNSASGFFGGLQIYRGIVNLTNCQITGNTAGSTFGGISVYQAELLNISDTTISGNDGLQGNTGGLSTDGSLIVNLVRLTVSGNTGTGIVIRSPGGETTVKDSTISNNAVRDFPSFVDDVGGGINVIAGSNTIKIINTTISGNSAPFAGGGIYNGGDDTQLINSTVVNNTVANTSGAGGGGGIYDRMVLVDGTFGKRIKLQNTIVANNSASVGPDLRIQVTSLGYNIIGNTAGSGDTSPTTGDQFNVDPRVAPLADNGGAVLTHALLPGSPAIDKGKSAGVITDARALPRPYNNPSIPSAAGGDGSDIGAFEDQPSNTAKGSKVTIESPVGDANITFPSVTKAGYTILAEIVSPSSVGVPPDGYTILDDAPAYDISTTATVTAPLTICFTVASIKTEADFARVRILHLEEGNLVDRTVLSPETPAPDFGTHTVCARVNSLSPFVVALAPVPPNQPLNIATRMDVLTGDKVLIGGFIITGNAPKKVLFRALGPSLTGAGISGALADPVLELHASDGAIITSNDNWQTTQKAAIIATGVPPVNDKESAIVATLEPGNYTAIVKGKGLGTGIGLVEGYDLDTAANSQFANISTRGFVEAGDNVMIGGFILGGGAGGTNILIRALGPSLAGANVSDFLANPTLELRNQEGELVASNDNWKDDQQAEIEATGVPPTKDLESALIMTLDAGNYTAIVAGKNGLTGVGLVEIYRLP